MDIIYLYHSAFAIKTNTHFFIFDYYFDLPKGSGLNNGVINPEKIKDLNVVVFCSHAHADHYNDIIFSWRKYIPNIRYILSDDIKTYEPSIKLAPNQTLKLDDLTVTTLKSTDEGVAFLLKADGYSIYHAGDLNWWNWEGETKHYNKIMADNYQNEIKKLAGEKIDVAFLPMDNRLADSYLMGLDYFMKTVGANIVIPMHTTNDEVYSRLASDTHADIYRNKIVVLSKRGQRFSYSAK
ncbi:MAG: MBL fold metallo-hydrolase [Oscillospiraceae bacterium]